MTKYKSYLLRDLEIIDLIHKYYDIKCKFKIKYSNYNV